MSQAPARSQSTDQAARATELPAPARVTMIGAGQLARMTWQAAIDLDVGLHVLAASDADPAVHAGAPFTLGSTDDYDDLLRAASHGDVVTFDHELVPQAHLRRLQQSGHVLRPHPAALAHAQDKLWAREALGMLGLPAPAFAPVSNESAVTAFAEEHGWPLIVKSRRGGYDGRGVHLVAGPLDAGRVMGVGAPGGEARWIAEEYIDLALEFAVVLARRPSGEVVTYPCVETYQLDGLCRELALPAALPDEVAERARELARRLAEGIDAVGICAVEMFLARDGRLLLNEIALRPHNSGHITIEACQTSQFEQHLRAVLDWPLGGSAMIVPAAATVNLIAASEAADPRTRLPAALERADANVHLYGKPGRPGRKIGHVTAVGRDRATALDSARRVADALMSP